MKLWCCALCINAHGASPNRGKLTVIFLRSSFAPALNWFLCCIWKLAYKRFVLVSDTYLTNFTLSQSHLLLSIFTKSSELFPGSNTILTDWQGELSEYCGWHPSNGYYLPLYHIIKSWYYTQCSVQTKVYLKEKKGDDSEALKNWWIMTKAYKGENTHILQQVPTNLKQKLMDKDGVVLQPTDNSKNESLHLYYNQIHVIDSISIKGWIWMSRRTFSIRLSMQPCSFFAATLWWCGSSCPWHKWMLVAVVHHCLKVEFGTFST